MKHAFKMPGMFLSLAVLGFMFVSCGQDEESPGSQVTVSGSSLARKIEWVQNHRSSGTTYILEVSADEALSGYELTSGSNRNMTIILNGNGNSETVISLKDGTAKWLFLAGDNVTLELNNITLKGHDHNRAPLVAVIGTLVMKGKSKIIENKNSIGGGCDAGGVWVHGTFIMEDGEISGNTFSSARNDYNGAGGVYVASYGTFTMNGGKIFGNSAGMGGGGVYVGSGSSTITANPFGPGVFIMWGGEISGNTATIRGGGVYAAPGIGAENFRIINGTIYGSNETGVDPETGADLKNTAPAGAALYGDAQYGTYDNGGTWNSGGSLSTTNNTVRVVKGVLQ